MHHSQLSFCRDLAREIGQIAAFGGGFIVPPHRAEIVGRDRRPGLEHTQGKVVARDPDHLARDQGRAGAGIGEPGDHSQRIAGVHAVGFEPFRAEPHLDRREQARGRAIGKDRQIDEILRRGDIAVEGQVLADDPDEIDQPERHDGDALMRARLDRKSVV